MRVALLLLISQVAWAGPFKPVKDTRPRIIPSGNAVSDCGRRGISRFGISCVNSSRTLALFEFAPPEGTGMGSACACAAVTGAKGETMTFTRASVGACTKGNETANIANGDVVFCGSGLPRVMPGGDGSGGLGISIWEARTNTAIRSQEFENAIWTKIASGVVAPVVTANAATAPDGTLTADQVDLPLTNGASGQFSLLNQAAGCPASGKVSAGFYAKMASGTGTIEFSGPGGTNGPNVVGAGFIRTCSINATTWTRCYAENITTASVMYIGYGGNGDSPAGPAESVYIWQADCQQGTTLAPPIATTSAAASTVADVAYAAVSDPGNVTGSMAGTYVAGMQIASSENAVLGESNTTTPLREIVPRPSASTTTFYGVAGAVNAGAGAPAGQHRVYAYWTGSGSAASVAVDGVETAGSITTIGSGTNRVYFGTYSANSPVNGVVKKICVDPSSTVCR